MQNFIQHTHKYMQKEQISKILFKKNKNQFAQIFHIYKNNSFPFGLDF